MASFDSEAILIADDDDIYFKNWVSGTVLALHDHVWTMTETAYEKRDDGLYWIRCNYLHSGAGFRKREFWEVGGYPACVAYEDTNLFKRMHERFGPPKFNAASRNETCLFIRCGAERNYATAHSSEEDYRRRRPDRSEKTELCVGWKQNYDSPDFLDGALT